MSERIRESLSALMDDEANELEIERVLGQLAAGTELRQTWRRYHLVRDSLAGRAMGQLELDVSTRVRAALSDPGVSAGGGPVWRFLRPLASLAVAASVAATVIFGGQQLAQMEASPYADKQSVASSVSPVGLLNSLGAVPVQASYGTQAIPVLQPATRTAYQALARQRMESYLQEHAEHAALNSPQGLMPFARVTHIQQ